MKAALWRGLALLLFSLSAMAAVNINTADQQALESLKGIGPAKARAIIDYRNQHGPFNTSAELSRVQGIGDKTVAKLGEQISVSGPTELAAP